MAWPSSWVTPSRVRSYIQAALGGVVPPPPPRDLDGGWRAESLSRASALLDAIEGIDQRILFESLTADEGFQWLQAASQLRSAVLAWQGGQNFVLVRAGALTAHPVLVIYRLLEGCPDEIAPRALPRLTFLNDVPLRENVARDIDSLEPLIRSGEWKAATVIGGSIVEAILLDALLPREVDAKDYARAQARVDLRRWRVGRLEKWDLWQLVAVCRHLGIIDDALAGICDAAREYRNLIHAGVERARHRSSPGTALNARSAVENLIERLTPRTPEAVP